MASTVSCDLRKSRGYHGHLLCAKLCKKKELAAKSVAVENVVERIKDLLKTSTQGATFAVSSGNHFTLHYIFKSADLLSKIARIKELTQSKKF